MNSQDKTTGHCPECGAATGCGMEQGFAHCWCFELPRPPSTTVASTTAASTAEASTSQTPDEPLPSELRCLCPACLQKLGSDGN